MSQNQAVILVGVAHGKNTPIQWQVHDGTFDEVVDRLKTRALAGQGTSGGYEVVQVDVTRAVRVKAVISSTEVSTSRLGPVKKTPGAFGRDFDDLATGARP